MLRFTFCQLFLAFTLSAAPSALVIQNVRVVDVNNGSVEPRSLLIQDGRIRSIAAAGSLTVPAGARILQGHGRYLIPGLWDMHVHLWYDAALLPLYVRHGVTGVRDMGSDPARTDKWEQEIAAGRLVGPRIITTGGAIDGQPSTLPELPVTVVRTPMEAKRAVEDRDDPRIDQVKILSSLSRANYLVVAERARNFRIPLVGHLPPTVSVWEAVNERQKSLEHLFGVLLSCSADEQSLRQRRELAALKNDQQALRQIAEEALRTYSPERARLLFTECARFNTWHTPTLTQRRRMAGLGLEELVTNPQLTLVPASVQKGWKDPRTEAREMSEATRDFLRREYEQLRTMLADLRQAGGLVLAGTDTGDPYLVPGAALHDELALMVDFGFSPLQALQAATRNAARFLKKEDDFGSVERGRIADLVLLEANPLEDIRNTRRIAAVVVGGEVLPGAPVVTTAPPAPAPVPRPTVRRPHRGRR